MTPSPHPARRVVAGAVIACSAALAAACSSSSPTPQATKTITVSASPTGSGTAPNPSSPVPAPSSPAPAGPGPCPTRYLKASLGLSQGAAGSVYQVIDFTNIGNVTCTLYGYPGVALAGGNPISQIGLAAAEDPASPRQLVTLAPGKAANALLRVVQAANFPASKCQPVQATYLQIYPPNQTTPVYLAYKATACAKPVRILSVQVVKPGTGG